MKELSDRIQENSNNWNWALCHGDIYTGKKLRNEQITHDTKLLHE